MEAFIRIKFVVFSILIVLTASCDLMPKDPNRQTCQEAIVVVMTLSKEYSWTEDEIKKVMTQENSDFSRAYTLASHIHEIAEYANNELKTVCHMAGKVKDNRKVELVTGLDDSAKVYKEVIDSIKEKRQPAEGTDKKDLGEDNLL